MKNLKLVNIAPRYKLDRNFNVPEEIETFFDEYDLSLIEIGDTSTYFEFNVYTPAGEDWNYGISLPTDLLNITNKSKCKEFLKEFGNKLADFYDSFDIEEEFNVWTDSRGRNGVPSSARILIEDQEWKEEHLYEQVNDFQKIQEQVLNSFIDNEMEL